MVFGRDLDQPSTTHDVQNAIQEKSAVVKNNESLLPAASPVELLNSNMAKNSMTPVEGDFKIIPNIKASQTASQLQKSSPPIVISPKKIEKFEVSTILSSQISPNTATPAYSELDDNFAKQAVLSFLAVRLG